MSYTYLANRIDSEYAIYLMALSGLYQAQQMVSDPTHVRSVSDMERVAMSLSHALMRNIVADLTVYLGSITQHATEDEKVALAERKATTLHLISAMLVENVNTIKRRTRANLSDYLKPLLVSSEAMKSLVHKRLSQVDFKATDTSGRKWDAKKLMHAIVRDFAYQSWIDSQVATYIEAGADLMMVVKGTQQVFSILNTPGYPSFSSVRASLFHPNSSAVMVPYVPS